MEKVRERKRRLIIYITIFAMCLCMQPGMVMKVWAADDDVNVVLQLGLNYSYDLGSGWTQAGSGNFKSTSSYKVGDEFKIPSVSTTDTKHNVVSWSYDESEVEPEATITLGEPDSDGNCVIYSTWGKYVEVTFSGSTFQTFPQKTSADTELITISFPTPVNLCSNGRFYQENWMLGNSAGISMSTSNSSTTFEALKYVDGGYNNNEIVLEATPQYDSNVVPDSGGSFTLNSGEPYQLGTGGSWEVDGDGCTYTGGITFYVDTGTYTYTRSKEK